MDRHVILKLSKPFIKVVLKPKQYPFLSYDNSDWLFWSTSNVGYYIQYMCVCVYIYIYIYIYCNALLGQQKGSLGCTCPTFRTCTTPEWRNRQVTSSQTPLTPTTTCLYFSLQADSTDLCALEHLGIKTVFPLSWSRFEGPWSRSFTYREHLAYH